MDHQTPEAGPVDVPAVDPADTQAAFKQALSKEQPVEAAEEAPAGDENLEELPEGDELEDGEAEEGEQEDERESAIDAPVSLNAEEKEAFGQLPQEAQSFVTALEARRNADVTKVTTRAADAQRAAEAQAAQAAIQTKQEFAQQLRAFTANFAPQAPDPVLAQTDPAQYIAQKAQYDAQIGHFQQLENQIEGIGSEAQQEAERTFIAQRDKALMQIPEIANEDTRQDYLDRVFNPEFLGRLNYDRAEIAQIADADDVKRLNSIAEAFEKADKYDEAMKKPMKRDGQGRFRGSTKPRPAQPKSSRSKDFESNVAALRKSGSDKDAQNAFAAALFK